MYFVVFLRFVVASGTILSNKTRLFCSHFRFGFVTMVRLYSAAKALAAIACRGRTWYHRKQKNTHVR